MGLSVRPRWELYSVATEELVYDTDTWADAASTAMGLARGETIEVYENRPEGMVLQATFKGPEAI